VRIAYVCHWNAFVLDGVARKLRTQVRTWRDLGHEVELFCLTPRRPGEPVTEGRLYPFSSAQERVRATARLVRGVRSFGPDAVYLRYDLWDPQVWLLTMRVPTVLEANTNDLAEFRRRRTHARAFNHVVRNVLLRSVRGIVAVSASVGRTYESFGKPTAVIANSIDPEFAPHLPPQPQARPHAVFMGSPRVAWAGVDKLLELARRLDDVQFDLIGWSAEDAGEPLPPNVTAHGYLDRAAYEPVLARADAAIGTLAMHRAGEEEASPLKTREYLLSGLPVVLAYQDADLLGIEPWWLLRIPNTEDNVAGSAVEIRSFLDQVRGRRVPREEVEPRIGPRAKEERRLAFIADVVR
jgi:glycosyltransferase involved in cell wall biosynthesis